MPQHMLGATVWKGTLQNKTWGQRPAEQQAVPDSAGLSQWQRQPTTS